MNKEDILMLALDAGFMVSTQYGQSENKLMPASDSATLLKFAKLVKSKLPDDYVFVCKKCGDEIGVKYEEKK